MGEKSGNTRRMSDSEYYKAMSRRNFCLGAGALAGAGAFGMLTGLASGPASASETPEEDRVTTELPVVDGKPLDQLSYSADIIVMGGGFAGVFAAVEAKQQGKSVLLVDKGMVGHSGYMPWPHTFRWFDEDLGDDRQAHRDAMMLNSEYTSNQDWYEIWMDESKSIYEAMNEWGMLDQYPNLEWEGQPPTQPYLYREQYEANDRHINWRNVLVNNDIDFIEHVMITDVLEEDGRTVGAIGIHNPTGDIVTFSAKAVIICAGAGCYKPTGYPTGTNSFDGEAIGYRHGLRVAGKEYSTHHGTAPYAPGSVYAVWGVPYLERMWLCGGSPQPDHLMANLVLPSCLGNIPQQDFSFDHAIISNGFGAHDLGKDDPRTGAWCSPMGSMAAAGGAVGMGIHKGEGIYLGTDVFDGDTGIPGFYVAGDSMASMVCGAIYCGGIGFSAGMSAIQGKRACDSACKYCDTVDLVEPSADIIASETDSIMACTKRDEGLGFNPNWARDALQSVMAPIWVNYLKTEATLNGALASVEYLRDNVIPKLIARNPHELRLCLEMENKVLSAEMKCRASLMRTESRGMHFRYDYPARDDENWLCYITIRKGDDGSMVLEKDPMKEEWKGDLTLPYTTRYPDRFPGELEYLGIKE